MSVEVARAVLQKCDPDILTMEEGQPDCAEAAIMLLYLTDSRRVQKVLWRQLSVLDSMLTLLEGLKSARQLMTHHCPPQPEGGARSRWKALKMASRSAVEQTENLLKILQEKSEIIHQTKHTLTLLVTRLQDKKQQCVEVCESLQKAHNALRQCDGQLTQLEAESNNILSQLIGWEQLKDQLQDIVSATQEVMQINLVTFNQSELCVELKPRPLSPSSSNENELDPLKLTITWSKDDCFTMQMDEGTVGLIEDSCSRGKLSELSAALLDVMQNYTGQYALLAEVQGLRSSFAIDWRPSQRLLVYLKSASLVCHIQVEDGYPSRGRATLLSVQRDGTLVDISELKPYQSEPSLTEWLVFLCSSPLI